MTDAATLLEASRFAKLTAFIVAELLIEGNAEEALERLAALDVSGHDSPENSDLCRSLCEQAIREAMA